MKGNNKYGSFGLQILEIQILSEYRTVTKTDQQFLYVENSTVQKLKNLLR